MNSLFRTKTASFFHFTKQWTVIHGSENSDKESKIRNFYVNKI